MIKLLHCSCLHAYQDKLYGKSIRLHNHGVKNKVWRCTVCKTEKPAEK